MNRVEVEVKFQDIDGGFAEEAELASFGVFCDESADVGFAHAAFFGDARRLECRACGGDVRVQA